MRIIILLMTFILSSIALTYFAIKTEAPIIYAQYLQDIEDKKALLVSAKPYKKSRKVYVPHRSSSLGEREIQKLLQSHPIQFKDNDATLVVNPTLYKIVKVLNHLNEEVALRIETHSDTTGSMKHNLLLSQQRADNLKNYFREKTNLTLIVAIGYGEMLSLKEKLIKLNLKRI